jgi:Bacterial DNA-binding protein
MLKNSRKVNNNKDKSKKRWNPNASGEVLYSRAELAKQMQKVSPEYDWLEFDDMLSTLEKTVKKLLLEDKIVYIRNLCSFYMTLQAPRQLNLHGQKRILPSRKVPKVRLSRGFKVDMRERLSNNPLIEGLKNATFEEKQE